MKLKSAKYYYKNNRKVPKQIKQSEIKSKKIQNSRKILKGGIRCASWNIAAINNNPFEYHIDDKDKLYSKLMKNVDQLYTKFARCCPDLSNRWHKLTSWQMFKC